MIEKNEQERTVGWVKHVVTDFIVLAIFYYSIRTAETITFVEAWLRPYWWLIVILAFTIFFVFWFRAVITSPKIASLIKRGVAWGYGERSRPVRWFVSLALFFFGFLQLVTYVTFLIGTIGFYEASTSFPEWMGLMLASWLMVAAITFSIILAYFHFGDDGATAETMEKRHHRLFKLFSQHPTIGALLYGTAASVIPIYTLWMFCGRIYNRDYNPPEGRSQLSSTPGILSATFGIIVLTILDTEIAASIELGAAATAPARFALLYIAIFLPFRLLLATQSTTKQSYLFEVLSGAFFFTLQLLLIVTILYY